MRLVGLDQDVEPVRVDALQPLLLEEQQRRPLEGMAICVSRAAQPLPGADVEGHARPAPVLDLELHGRVGLGLRAAAAPWARSGRPATPLRRPPRPRRTGRAPCAGCTSSGVIGRMASSTFTFSLRTASAASDGGRLHGHQREELEDVVLDHVADHARLVVVVAPLLHPQLLGHGDLDVVDVAPVPDRLEDAVGEAEDEEVLDRLLPEVVIDPVDLRSRAGSR